MYCHTVEVPCAGCKGNNSPDRFLYASNLFYLVSQFRLLSFFSSQVVAKADFNIAQNDELHLTKGRTYLVEKDCGDGWGFGHAIDSRLASSKISASGYFPLVSTAFSHALQF